MAGIIANPKLPKPTMPNPMMGGGYAGMTTNAAPGGLGRGLPTPPPRPNVGGTSVSPTGQVTTIQQGANSGVLGLGQPGTGSGYGEFTVTNPLPGTTPYSAPMPSGQPPSMGGGDGGGGGDTPPAPGMGKDDIMQILKDLRGDQVPREPTPNAPPRIGAPTPAAQPPSQSLGFARAKDQSGRIGAAALRALKDQMTERGISGSGIEGELTGNVLGDVARQQSDAAFQQQRAAEDQAWQAAQQGYQGDITQRAQDLGLSSAGYSGGITQRGQDMNQNNMTQLAPTILSILSRARY